MVIMKIKSSIYGILLILLVLTLCCGCIDEGSLNYLETENITCKVLDKERVVETTSDGTVSYYLIYTDIETLKITDSLLYLKFHSSDIYGKIEEGKIYQFTVYGIRSGIISEYRNIIEYKEYSNEI